MQHDEGVQGEKGEQEVEDNGQNEEGVEEGT